MVRMPGFGLDGPWRDNPAFAFVIEDASGPHLADRPPRPEPGRAVLRRRPERRHPRASGLLLALEHRRRTGEGVLVEAAMVDAALNVAAEQVVEHSAYGALLRTRRQPRTRPRRPRTSTGPARLDEFGRPDDWVAIAVATDEQWRPCVAALGDPDWATDPALATAAGRRRAPRRDRRAPERGVPRGPATRSSKRLWEAGVPVAKVMQPHRVGDLPQLEHRGFFEEVDHPVNGTARHSTLPMRFSAGRSGSTAARAAARRAQPRGAVRARARRRRDRRTRGPRDHRDCARRGLASAPPRLR